MANEGGNDNGDELQLLVQHGDDVVAAVQAAADLRRLLYDIGHSPADWCTVGWDVHDLPETKRPAAERLEQTFRDRIGALGRRHAAALQLFERVHDAIVLANPEGLRPMFSMSWNDSSAVHVMVRLAGDLLAHHERGEFAALIDNHELTAGCGRLDGLEQLQHRVRLDVARLRRMQPAPPPAPSAVAASAAGSGEAESTPATNASPQAVALGMLMQGRSVARIAKELGLRRQDLYEKQEWTEFARMARTRTDAKKEARRDRRDRRTDGQNPDRRDSEDDR